MNDPARTFFPAGPSALPSPPHTPAMADSSAVGSATPQPADVDVPAALASPEADAVALPPSPSSTSFELSRSTPLPLSPPTSPTLDDESFPEPISEPVMFSQAEPIGDVAAVEPVALSSVAEAVRPPPPPPAAAPSAGVQLPATAVDSPVLAAGVPKTLQKKKSILGFNKQAKDRSVSNPTAGTPDKDGGGKKSSLMGGLIRTLTGRGSSKAKQTKPAESQKGLGLGSVFEDKAEKARLEQLEAANAAKLNNHVATLLVPSNRQARPLSNSFTSPSSLAAVANGAPTSPPRKSAPQNGAPEQSSQSSSPQKQPSGPNNIAGTRVVSQPPPNRSYPPASPKFNSSNSYNSGNNKPKLAVSVPPAQQFTTARASPPRVSGSAPIPIRTSPTQQQSMTPAATYAAHHSGSSGGSCGSDSGSDSEDGEGGMGLTIRKRARASQPTPIDEDEAGSNISHSISPTTPGVPMTPTDIAVSPTNGHGRDFFASVRGRNGAGGGGGGGGRPLSMHFNNKSNQQQQQQLHYQTYQQQAQKQMNRQSRIPVAPQMHTPAEVAAKVAESGKDEEVFFM